MTLFSVYINGAVYAQNFENVTITGVISGAGSEDAVFIATSPTIPSLARIRVQKLSGVGTVEINQNGDNFEYWHRTGFSSGH
ncbi:hypothetical protein JCM19302_3259 [Jejuia pallidilutea]|uniref:Uncharacterized protein n=1 Tax=Jejuia pallidilutea TaxID=504487 RepID=A0A090W8V5_9FLAO|nr:hypothetical protein JCM19302_3259 [Jejuia pallidilutea]